MLAWRLASCLVKLR
ncbi:hypothetical protein AB8G41_32070, partial [Salmonella enterica]